MTPFRQAVGHLFRSYGASFAVWGGIAATVLSQIVGKVAIPLTIATWIETLFFGHERRLGWVLVTAVLYVVQASFGFVGDYVFIRASDARYETLVSNFYRQIMRKDVSFFRTQRAGELAALFRDHLDGTINLFRLVRVGWVPLGVATLFPAVALLFYDDRVAAIFAFAVAVRAYVSLQSQKKTAPLRKVANRAYQSLSGVMGDQMAHLSVVRASANYALNRDRVVDLAAREGRSFWERHRLALWYDAISNMLVALCFTAIFAVITRFSDDNGASFMVAVLAILFVMQGMQAAQDVGDLNHRWSDHWERMSSSLVKIGDERSQAESRSTVSLLKPADGRIDIVDLQFSYSATDENERVFDRLNLCIPNGTHFAVVGENGAGKSTLVNLLMRFDSPDAGRLLLGGCDIQELSAQTLYRSLAYVPQDPKLFNETLSHNVMFFEPDASLARVNAAYDATMLRDLLSARSSGGERPVGEDGMQLSGGERQRVAIARALLRDAHVYIFDEATSQLKSDDGEAILAAVKRLLVGKTFMFVTHSRELQEQFSYVLDISTEGARWLGHSPTLVLPLLPDSTH